MSDPEVQYLVRDISPDGRIVLRPEAFPGEVERMVRDPEQRDRVVTADPRAVAAQQRDAEVQRRFGTTEGQAATAAGGALDTLTAGGATALLSPEQQAVAGMAREANPGSYLAGNIAAAFVPVLGSRGALGRAVQGVPGLAAAAGEAATARIAGAGGSQLLARALGGGVEAGLSGLGFAMQNSIINDEPLTAEQLMADVGPVTLLGIGLGGALGAGSSGLSRLRNARAQRMANSAFGEGTEAAGRFDGLAARIQDTSEAVGFGTQEGRVLTRAQGRRDVVEGAAELSNVTRRLSEQLDATAQAVDGLAPNASRRASRYQGLAGSVDDATSSAVTQSTLGRIGANLDTALASTSDEAAVRLLQGARAGMSRVSSRIGNATSAGERLAAIEDAADSLRALRATTDATGHARGQIGAARGVVEAQIEELERFAANPNAFGDAALRGQTLREANTVYQAQRARLFRDFGTSVTENGAVREAVDGNRMAAVFREAQGNLSDNKLAAVTDYLDAAEVYQRALADVFEVPTAEMEALATNTAAMREMLEEGSRRATNIGQATHALTIERGEAGASIVGPAALSPGSIGAAVGGTLGAFGGPLGAVGGAVAGAGLGMLGAAITRPASALMRLGRAEQGLMRVFQRRSNAFSKLRSTLSGTGGRMRTTGGALTRRVPDVVQRLGDRKNREAEYVAMRDEIRELTSRPELLEERLLEFAAMGEDMPGPHGKASYTAVLAVSYLGHQLPPQDLPGPFDHLTKEMPSQAEMDAFRRKVHALEDPYSIVEMAANFTLHVDQVEAVAAVYPEIYADIQAESARITSELTALPAYQARIAVGTLMAIPVDTSLSPDFINRMQTPRPQTQAQRQVSSSRRIQTSTNTYSESQSMSLSL